MHYYTRWAEKSHGAQTMTSKWGFTRSVIIKNGKSFIVNCGFCAWPLTFDNPIPYQYKPFDVYKYIGSWSIVYRCMEWNYNYQTTVFFKHPELLYWNNQSINAINSFYFSNNNSIQCRNSANYIIMSLIRSPTSILMTNTYNIQFKVLHVLSENAIADA